MKRITTLQTLPKRKGFVKGSPEALAAGAKAKATRLRNLQGEKEMIKDNIPSEIIQNPFKSKKLKIKFVHNPKPLKATVLPVKKVKDGEELVILTDGPTKVTYSKLFRTLKISPHHIQLTNK